jgi:cobyrinic acid a,c-diamide synthase
MNKKAFLISSDKSNSGKTILSIALSRYFLNQGYKTLAFKCGPDYIDTLHLSNSTKSKAYNLDTVLMDKTLIKNSFNSKLLKNDIAIVEGVMGFYDGVDYKNFKGSSFDIASTLKIPIIFILDASASSYTIAARLKGLISMSKNIKIAGVILNKITSKRHKTMIEKAINYHTNIDVIGAIPKNEELHMTSRHLGIKTATEIEDKTYSKIASICSKYINFKKLIENINYKVKDKKLNTNITNTNKTAYIAFDKAFNFYYQDNIDFLINKGFKIKYFSPLNNELPENPDFIYFGGGYPELYAKELSKASKTKNAIFEFSKQGINILAECGGMMYLSKSIYKENISYEMCNIFDTEIEMTKNRQSLGYVELKSRENTTFFNKNNIFTGHEFHYSKIKKTNENYIFDVKKITSEESYKDGFFKYNTLASYTHFHFLSKENIIKNII